MDKRYSPKDYLTEQYSPKPLRMFVIGALFAIISGIPLFFLKDWALERDLTELVEIGPKYQFLWLFMFLVSIGLMMFGLISSLQENQKTKNT